MTADFAHMNIFFVVTTAVVIVLGILLAVALYKLVRILGNVEHVSENISEESDSLRADVAELRSRARKEGVKVSSWVRVLRRMVARWFSPSQKKRNK